MKLDQIDESSKRDHIRQDLDKNLFIEAGAGAGKTSLLVDRVSNLLQRPGVRPEEIVVITFTNAAAGELYERVAGRLRILAESEDASEQIQEAYAHLDRIHISTIHHFCHEILSQRTFDANLVLDLQMEEADDTKTRENAFLDDYMAKSTDSSLRDIRAAFGPNYLGCVRDTFYRLADRKNAEYIYDEKIAAVSADTMRSEAYEICTKIDTSIRKGIDALSAEGIVPAFTRSQGGEEACKKLGRAISRYRSGLSRDLVLTAWRWFNRSKPQLFGVSGFKGNDKELIKATDADITAGAKELIGAWLPRFEEWKADHMLLYVLGAVEVYQRQPESKYISNDRLLYETEDLLRSDEARQYLKSRYRYLFVDEYQDTDDMQTDIIWKLAMDEEEHTHLQDGALVVVGDPKQAIYRFRGADSTLFEKTRKRMQDLPNVLDVTLQDNYRSSGSVIRWVNDRFDSKWNSGQSAQNYVEMHEGSVRKSFGREESEGSFLCGTYYCAVPKTKDKPHDRSALIQLVRDLTDGNHQIAVKNGLTNTYEMKAIGYEDILILTWYTTDIPEYVRAFKDEGIPANVYGAITFEETYIRRFAAILQYLADPEDRNLFANAKQALAHKDLEQMDSEDSRKTGYVFGEIRRRTREMAPKAVVHYLENHPEYWLDWNCDISSNDLYNARKSVINMVEQIDASDNHTLTEISAYVNQYIDDKHEREAEISADVRQVRMMNVHKAKGLEGHIVIIADRDDIKRYSSTYKEGRKFYEVISYSDTNGGTPQTFETFAGNSAIMAKADAASQLDQDRLEYVAATRAAEVLIFMGEKEHAIDCPFNEVNADAGGLPDINDILHPDWAEKDDGREDMAADEQEDICEYEPVNNGTVSGDDTPSFITLNPSRLAAEDDTDAGESGGKGAPVVNRPSGNVFGTVMHRCFELLVMRRSKIFHTESEAQDAEVSRLIRQAMLESNADIHEEEKNGYFRFLTKLMRDFLSNEKLTAAIEEASEVHTELGFSYYVSGQSDPEFVEAIDPYVTGTDLHGRDIWVNGTADLVLQMKDGSIRIIDYKSNVRGSMPAETFREKMYQKYAGQLLLYRYAMARLYSTDPDHVSAELYLIDGE